MLLQVKEFTNEIWSGRSNVENEVGLHGAGRESGLHGMRSGDLGGCRLNCPKKHCRAKIGEHSPESQTQRSRGGSVCRESRLEVAPKVLGRRQKGQVVLDVQDHQEVPKVHWSQQSGV